MGSITRNRLLDYLNIRREEIQNRNRLLDLAGNDAIRRAGRSHGWVIDWVIAASLLVMVKMILDRCIDENNVNHE